MREYLRFAALGDSTPLGIGDPVPDGWRGWARLLADAFGTAHDVSFCNLAVSGATAADLRSNQLEESLAHRPDVASLIVGVNDTMRSTWNPARIREDLLTCAEALHGVGALLLTVRFHDHGAVFGLPPVLRRPLWRRIEQVNAVYDEVYRTFGGVRIDLGTRQEVKAREFWSVDRLHPSELGHRVLAHAFATLINEVGIGFDPPSLERDGGRVPNRWQDLHWMVTAGAPWMGRRARDLGPWVARMALSELVARPR
jgi:lysophospholipase L1-like esterase